MLFAKGKQQYPYFRKGILYASHIMEINKERCKAWNNDSNKLIPLYVKELQRKNDNFIVFFLEWKEEKWIILLQWKE